ncbi:MAG: hypothetical protein HZC40_10410 [Chloroflexi bacterium]|nr:hypothetical protein [Chloroflexota bacterium]
MLNKFASICAIAILVLFVLGATACSQIPGASNPAQPPAPAAPTAVPTPEPTRAPAPSPEANNASPQRGAPGIEGALKNLGLVAGIVRASNTQGVALQTPKGNEKIRVDANAVIVIPGKADARLSDLKTGDRVVAQVKDATASFLLVLPKDVAKDALTLGAVQTNARGQITLRTRNGQDELTTSATTIVIKNDQGQITTGALSDVKPGSAALVIEDGSGNAQVIVMLKDDARALLGRGNPNSPKPKNGAP